MVKKEKITKLFWLSGVFIMLLVATGITNPKKFASVIETVNNYISISFGDFYLVFMMSALLIFFLIGVSPLGKIRFGGQDAKPEFSFVSWFSMLFCAGMGIGLMFWGAAEPLYHFINPPIEGDLSAVDRKILALQVSFFHWGLHPWALYGFAALIICFFSMNLKRGHNFSSFIKDDGTRFNYILRRSIDFFTIIAILFGVTMSFGLGVLQLEAGLQNEFKFESSVLVQLGIIAFITAAYIISTLRGMDKGIKLVSNVSMALCILMLGIVFYFMPKVNLFTPLFQSFPEYISKFPELGMGMLNYTSENWLTDWTTKYWSWWIAFAPFVGIFVALVSKGRTVRELVFLILAIPTTFCCIWFTVFGGAAIGLQMENDYVGNQLQLENTNAILFYLLNEISSSPVFTSILTWLNIAIIAMFFINSADSATYTLSYVSKKCPDKEPTAFMKISWGMLFTVLAILFLYTGGLKILQQITLVTALPFTGLLIITFCFVIFEMIKYYKNNFIKSKKETSEELPEKSPAAVFASVAKTDEKNSLAHE